MSLELRELRRSLERAQSANFVGRPLSAAQSEPRLVRPGSAAKTIKPADHSREIGAWVANRLAELQAAEDETTRKLAEGRHGSQAGFDDPSLWDADRVRKWCAESVGLSSVVVDNLHEQSIHGLELFTLDDADLCALGCPLADRKRLLAMTAALRREAPAAQGQHQAGSSGGGFGGVGSGAFQQHLSCRRERLTVLGQCLGRVLSFCPGVPLRTRRLIAVLWQQTEAIGVESLAQIERDAAASRRRAFASAERQRRRTRNALEPHIATSGLLEDMIHELQEALATEKAQLKILRDSMDAPSPSRRRTGGSAEEAHRTFKPSEVSHAWTAQDSSSPQTSHATWRDSHVAAASRSAPCSVAPRLLTWPLCSDVSDGRALVFASSPSRRGASATSSSAWERTWTASSG